ncbi:hypothetical protein NO559_16410 [Dasania sp. GY-MA-18]|uniref:DUF6538 domain-containing protein n=1 Tax=Dasania sp. GY-MA-18 TaxID=2966584 RepID=UPI0021AC9E27|nr:DUF6538 domain-containing protein [Dasania sp. GY-MA-18]MCR8924357.1 hypothetical protein [Dasania sp. GY-MA-18]
MSRYTNLQRRNGRLYFRIRVPKDLVEALAKKEIKKSLGTSDLREAKLRLPIEQLKAEELFAKTLRVKLKKQTKPTPLSRTEIERCILLWHRNEVTRHANEDDSSRIGVHQDERSKIFDVLREDLSSLDGENEAQYASSVQSTAKQVFEQTGIALNTDTDESRYAYSLVHQALIEQTYLSLERFGDSYDRVPFSLFSSTPVREQAPSESKAESLNLITLIDKFIAAKQRDGITDKSLAGYRLTFDFSKELFSPYKDINSIKPEDCRTFRDTLSSLPSNAKKRYPNTHSWKLLKRTQGPLQAS